MTVPVTTVAITAPLTTWTLQCSACSLSAFVWNLSLAFRGSLAVSRSLQRNTWPSLLVKARAAISVPVKGQRVDEFHSTFKSVQVLFAVAPATQASGSLHYCKYSGCAPSWDASQQATKCFHCLLCTKQSKRTDKSSAYRLTNGVARTRCHQKPFGLDCCATRRQRHFPSPLKLTMML